VSLLVGGMMAGAGQRRGALYGAVVGVYNSILFLIVYVQVLGQQLGPGPMIILPILQIAFGTAGGFAGNQIWKPIQPLSPQAGGGPGRGPSDPVSLPRPHRQSPLAGPVNWVRVMAGTALAIVGCFVAPDIFKLLLSISDQATDTQRQAQFLTWEISVLAVFIGGAIAGSNSTNGLKQGLLVGSIASMALVFIYVYRGDTGAIEPASIFKFFGIEEAAFLLQKIIFTVLSVLPLSLVGGWFGGQLLPPLLVPSRRKRMLPGGM
jgi:hypothetical protein